MLYGLDLVLLFLVVPAFFLVKTIVSIAFAFKYKNEPIYEKCALIWFFCLIRSICRGLTMSASPVVAAVTWAVTSFLVMVAMAGFASYVLKYKNNFKLDLLVFIPSIIFFPIAYSFSGFNNNLLFFPLFVAAAFPVLKLIPLARKTKVLNFTRIGAITCYIASAIQVVAYLAVIYNPELFFTFHLFILVLAAGASSFSFAALVERSVIDNDLKNVLQNTSRLTALGSMAAEISHEIRNPVTVLSLNNSQLLSSLESKRHVDVAHFRNKLEVADAMLNRLTDIMQTLRAHYNNGAIDSFKNEKIQRIFEEVRMVSELKAKRLKIEINFKCEDDSLSIDCRSVQIIQAVQNLIQNSMDEISDVHEPVITVDAKKMQGELVRISVTDNGQGVPKEIRPYIFDSFFTTKPSDKGSGLGLSISKRLVEDHGGTLFLEDTLPTTFVIILPVRRVNSSLFVPEKRLAHWL